MGTSRILEQLLGGGAAGRPSGGGGLDSLLGGLMGGGATPRPGAGVPPQGGAAAGMGGAGMGGGLGGLLGSLAGGGRPGAGGLADILGGLMGGGRPGAGAPTNPGAGAPMGGGLAGGLGGLLGGLRAPMGGAAGAAAAGGLLGSLLGGRRGGGGLVRMGGMAMLGLLAHRAYEQWKAQQAQGRDAAAPAPGASDFARADAPDGEGNAFGLSVVKAMVAAARADGQIDSREHERIFAEAEKLALDPAEKGEMFRILEAQADPAAIARLAATEAQKAELYLASAIVIGVQSASERVYLDALAHHLGLERGLRATLDQQVHDAAELEEQAARSF